MTLPLVSTEVNRIGIGAAYTVVDEDNGVTVWYSSLRICYLNPLDYDGKTLLDFVSKGADAVFLARREEYHIALELRLDLIGRKELR